MSTEIPDTITELYRKHRPKAFKTVLGQDDSVSILHKMVQDKRVPHTMLFSGPSGCGKTTLARILASKLECGEADLQEINAADTRGIETVREIRARMQLAPISGKVRVWLIDEAHKLSNDAQNAFLKILEDTPRHVYFMLATTDPAKLLKTIQTRCTEIRVREMSVKAMQELLETVAEKEGITLTDEVKDKIVECAQGSARLALVLLNKIVGIDDPERAVEVIMKGTSNVESIALARALLNPRTTWPELAALIKAIDDEPESVRWVVQGYMSSVLLGGGKMAPRAFEVLEEFRDNFFDTKKAGLVRACYALTLSKR